MTKESYQNQCQHKADRDRDGRNIDDADTEDENYYHESMTKEDKAKETIFEDHDSYYENEVDILRRLRLTQCSHMVQYRGHGTRHLTHTIIEPGEYQTKEMYQNTRHLYQSWASRGDLDDLIQQHKRSKRSVAGEDSQMPLEYPNNM